jgi:RAMP superfamily
MSTYLLAITLRSDATFGRGDGVAGLVDQEVEHDANGFPYLRGRTLKGLLSEECDNIVAVLPERTTDWNAALARLFGVSGSDQKTAARWHIGDALLPDDLRLAIGAQLDAERSKAQSLLATQDILESLTTLRRQTAMDAKTGTPDTGSLRAMRVIRQGLTFTSRLEALDNDDGDLWLLAAGCLALRHIGTGRNRGRGWVRCRLHSADGIDITDGQFARFRQEAT